MSTPEPFARKPMLVRPQQGRTYEMGRMQATFFADDDETGLRHSISEWWMQPRTPGPGPHSHEEDHIFRVLSGTLSLFLNGEWSDAPAGSYAVIPAGTLHDFENRTDEPCGFLAITEPAGFEQEMPGIVQWFVDNPAQELPASYPSVPPKSA